MKNTNLFKILFTGLIILCFPFVKAGSQSVTRGVTFAVARMNHDHIGFILGRVRKSNPGYSLAGIYEPDQKLVQKYSKSYNLDASLFYDDLEKMLDEVKPVAVLAFGSTFDHLSVVEACAPRGIHVMVEKPLAVNMDHAAKMKSLADKYKIHLLTDYETSWYPSTAKAWQLVNDSSYVGTLRKVVVHDGHSGPVEIGCSKEFLSWLTDPVLNGGGALTDFGCYGANLMTYLTNGMHPVSVTAVTRTLKPSVYPKVDDDAVIIVSYPASECIIQASWNWPFSRKDIEIYGASGYVMADNNYDMRQKAGNQKNELKRRITAGDVDVYEDPFSYFAGVINRTVRMKDFDPYSLENNMMVVKILDAARESSKTGKTITFR
jgi:predicted dehydrogenase